MKKVGFVGQRGMVGQVLMERMSQENDWSLIWPCFFSTSQVGGQPPAIGKDLPLLKDAYNIKDLMAMDIIITCQGGEYTKQIYPQLKRSKWNGYWIDASSALRMDDETVIVLDPINYQLIQQSLKKGIKSFAGGNCTVSLMLMALGGLFQHQQIEWLSSMTYQAASGAGAKQMQELVAQMCSISKVTKEIIDNPASRAIELDRVLAEHQRSADFPVNHLGVPLAGNLIPWIDSQAPDQDGQSREEWKGMVETNRILNSKSLIPVDGICVRVSSMRCHSQAFTIKLKKDIPLDEINELIATHNEWVKVIPNDQQHSIHQLTPVAVTGTLAIPVGRIRKMKMGGEYLTAFTVGDQLLWGAAEPLRRVLRILLNEKE